MIEFAGVLFFTLRVVKVPRAPTWVDDSKTGEQPQSQTVSA